MRPNEGVTLVVESPAQMESAIVATVPIQWEQNRVEVRRAILYHRWASLKLRKLAREQAAIDWTATPEWRAMNWVREHQELIALLAMLGLAVGILTGSIHLW